MATKEQLRKIRQKYHLGEFRRAKKTHLRKSLKGGKTDKMAKKKRYGKRRKSGGITGGILQQGIGVGTYILFEAMVEPRLLAMLNVTQPILVNVGELILGTYLAKKGGIIGAAGKAAITINLYQLLHPYLSGTNKGNGGLSYFS